MEQIQLEFSTLMIAKLFITFKFGHQFKFRQIYFIINLWNQGTKSLLKKASKILFPTGVSPRKPPFSSTFFKSGFFKREPEPLLNRGFTGALPPCWSKSAVGGAYPRVKEMTNKAYIYS